MNHRITFVWLLAVALAAAGCSTFGKHEYTSLRVFLQTTPQLPQQERSTVVVSNPPMNVTVKRLPELSEIDLVKAEAVKTDTRKQLVLQFDRRGTLIISNFTTERRGELYVLVLNNIAIAAPVIRDTIADGRLVIDVDQTDADLDKLVKGLNNAVKKAHF